MGRYWHMKGPGSGSHIGLVRQRANRLVGMGLTRSQAMKVAWQEYKREERGRT